MRGTVFDIRRFLHLGGWSLAALLAAACARGGDRHTRTLPDDVIIEFADTFLTRSDVESRIPAGISSEDSTQLFDRIAEEWLDGRLLSDMAAGRLDNLDEIERKVDEYRCQLIVAEYLRKVGDSGRRQPDKGEIETYYRSHPDELTLETPIVKGVYLKLPESADRLPEIRRWVFGGRDGDIDNIERYGLSQALQYDYFNDRWVDWQNLAAEIPYNFGDPDQFVADNVNFETTHGGATYLLHIGKYISSGNLMPLDYASPLIASILEQRNARSYARAMVDALCKRAVKEERLKFHGWQPQN